MRRDAAAMRAYRAANPGYTDRNRQRAKARSAALEALARNHPAEFAELLDAALNQEGQTSHDRPR